MPIRPPGLPIALGQSPWTSIAVGGWVKQDALGLVRRGERLMVRNAPRVAMLPLGYKAAGSARTPSDGKG